MQESRAGWMLRQFTMDIDPANEQFLEFCVSNGEMEPLFVRLVEEYRAAPTVAKAVALYDVFCAPCAPAKIDAAPCLPPRDMRIPNAMRPIRLNWTRMQAAYVFGPSKQISNKPPSRSLFDAIARYLARAERLLGARKRYQTWRGGICHPTEQHEHFVRRIWQPIVSPHLSAAGFSALPELPAFA